MNAPDFEIEVRLRAQELLTLVPPSAQTMPHGEGTVLGRRQTRRGLPTEMTAGARYSDVLAEKQIRASIALLAADKPAYQGGRRDSQA